MVTLAGTQAANDCQVPRVRGESRQVLAEAEIDGIGRDLLKLAAVNVIRLHVKRIRLTWSASHPQQNAASAALRVSRDRARQPRQPRRRRDSQQTCARRLQPTTA
jgi:hypothetical protein